MYDDRSMDASSIDAVRYKIVFVGDVSVGKTSIMNRFIENKFSEAYDPSIGVDFHSKIITYKNRPYKLQFWDSAGQEKYKSLIPSYVRGASIIFIIFDKSSKY
jgi:small GTP-binding protein